MSQNSQDKKAVSTARQAMEELLNHDGTLKSEYIKAAEAEYETLVKLVQSRNLAKTEEIQALADEIEESL